MLDKNSTGKYQVENMLVSIIVIQITIIIVLVHVNILPSCCQELAVWAYPTKLGQMKDSIVCSIRDNPELVIINVSCCGVRPELELESKHLHFDRTLLHRYQNKYV